MKDDLYTGSPFGGVGIICKDIYLFSVRELYSPSDRTVAIQFCDRNDKIIKITCNVYMHYYDQGNRIQTELLLILLMLYNHLVVVIMWCTLSNLLGTLILV